jgi:hypothetical protein
VRLLRIGPRTNLLIVVVVAALVGILAIQIFTTVTCTSGSHHRSAVERDAVALT